jgi:hypothetical protein
VASSRYGASTGSPTLLSGATASATGCGGGASSGRATQPATANVEPNASHWARLIRNAMRFAARGPGAWGVPQNGQCGSLRLI